MTNVGRDSTDGEVLIGASSIAKEILGSNSPRAVRQVRHLHETGQIPTFKLNRSVCLRPKTWREHIAQREAEAEERREEARSGAEVA